MMESKRVRQGEVNFIGINFKDDIPSDTKFVRTRHKSIRCFPFCSPIHKSNSFCGNPLYVTITDNLISSLVNDEDVNLIGEFRRVEDARSFEMKEGYTDKGLIQARLFKRDGNKAFFIFMPPGKWTYDSKLKPNDRHVFTVYYVFQGLITAFQDSNSFQIIPVWKLGHEKEPDVDDDKKEPVGNQAPPHGGSAETAVTQSPISSFMLSQMEQPPYFPLQNSFPLLQRGFMHSAPPTYFPSSGMQPLYPLLPRPMLPPPARNLPHMSHHPIMPPQIRPPFFGVRKPSDDKPIN
jgi:hypothetical protein